MEVPIERDSSSAGTYSRRQHGMIAAGLALLAVWLRSGALLDTWFSVDEGMQLYLMAEASVSELFYLRSQAHPPGFFLFGKAILSVLGFDGYIARSISLVCAVATLPVAYAMGRALAGPVAGVIALAILTVSSGAIVQSQIIRQYSELLFLSYLVVWLTLRFINRPSPTSVVTINLTLFVGVLLHYGFVPLIPVLAVIVWWRLKREGMTAPEIFVKNLGFVSTLPLLAAFYFLFRFSGERPSIGFWVEYAREQYLALYFNDSAMSAGRNLLDAALYFFNYPVGFLAPFLFAAGCWCLWCGNKRYELVLSVLGCGAFFLLSLAGQYPYGGTRHILFLLPFHSLPIIYVCTLIWKLPRPASKVVLVILFILSVSQARTHISIHAIKLSGRLLPRVSPITYELPAGRRQFEMAGDTLRKQLRPYSLAVFSPSAYWQLYPLFRARTGTPESQLATPVLLMEENLDTVEQVEKIIERQQRTEAGVPRIAVITGEWDRLSRALEPDVEVAPGIRLFAVPLPAQELKETVH